MHWRGDNDQKVHNSEISLMSLPGSFSTLTSSQPVKGQLRFQTTGLTSCVLSISPNWPSCHSWCGYRGACVFADWDNGYRPAVLLGREGVERRQKVCLIVGCIYYSPKPIENTKRGMKISDSALLCSRPQINQTAIKTRFSAGRQQNSLK